MNHHRTGTTSILLFALVASPVVLADQAVPLPDLSAALQSRIDSRMDSTLSTRAGAPRTTVPTRSVSTERRSPHSTASGSGRTDEPGWKPYHSTM